MDSKLEGDCLIWDRGLTSDGYGSHNENVAHGVNRPRRAMQTAFEAFYGPIGVGKQVRHLCGVRACYNPLHLWIGNNSDNALDSVVHGTHRNSRKSLCPNGHEYDMVWSDGKRRCRTCRRLQRTRTS